MKIARAAGFTAAFSVFIELATAADFLLRGERRAFRRDVLVAAIIRFSRCRRARLISLMGT